MKDLNQIEEEQDKMSQNFQALRNEIFQLCKEKESLMAECAALKEESQALKLECEQLKSIQSSALSSQECYGQLFFKDHGERVRYYLGYQITKLSLLYTNLYQVA